MKEQRETYGIHLEAPSCIARQPKTDPRNSDGPNCSSYNQAMMHEARAAQKTRLVICVRATSDFSAKPNVVKWIAINQGPRGPSPGVVRKGNAGKRAWVFHFSVACISPT